MLHCSLLRFLRNELLSHRYGLWARSFSLSAEQDPLLLYAINRMAYCDELNVEQRANVTFGIGQIRFVGLRLCLDSQMLDQPSLYRRGVEATAHVHPHGTPVLEDEAHQRLAFQRRLGQFELVLHLQFELQRVQFGNGGLNPDAITDLGYADISQHIAIAVLQPLIVDAVLYGPVLAAGDRRKTPSLIQQRGRTECTHG